MNPLDLVKLTPLMALNSGKGEVKVGLIDGPVAVTHSDLASNSIREVGAKGRSGCTHNRSAACAHGTFIAGILSAKRSSSAPGICPDCTVLVRPIFLEATAKNGEMPRATPDELAEAIIECVDAGARVINLSVALAQPSSKSERKLEQSLDYALLHGTIVVAAAGNQGTVGSTCLTRHPWVIPVVAYDLQGRPLNQSNLGNSIGRRGVGAPGEAVTSLSTNDKMVTSGGTSVSAPFVTGTIALLWSEFSRAIGSDVMRALTQSCGGSRRTVVPPLLDAWRAYQFLASAHSTRAAA